MEQDNRNNIKQLKLKKIKEVKIQSTLMLSFIKAIEIYEVCYRSIW